MTFLFNGALNPEPGALRADYGPALPGAAFDQLDPDTQRACKAISCLAHHIATAQTAEVLERLSRLLERTNLSPVAPFVHGQFKGLEKAVLSHWRTEPCPCHLDTLGYLAHRLHPAPPWDEPVTSAGLPRAACQRSGAGARRWGQ